MLSVVLASWDRSNVLEEPAVIGILRRQINGEPCLRAAKAAMDVAVAYGRVTPLVHVDVRLREEGVGLRGVKNGRSRRFRNRSCHGRDRHGEQPNGEPGPSPFAGQPSPHPSSFRSGSASSSVGSRASRNGLEPASPIGGPGRQRTCRQSPKTGISPFPCADGNSPGHRGATVQPRQETWYESRAPSSNHLVGRALSTTAIGRQPSMRLWPESSREHGRCKTERLSDNSTRAFVENSGAIETAYRSGCRIWRPRAQRTKREMSVCADIGWRRLTF